MRMIEHKLVFNGSLLCNHSGGRRAQIKLFRIEISLKTLIKFYLMSHYILSLL